MAKEKQFLEESKEDRSSSEIDLQDKLKEFYSKQINLPKFIEDEDIPTLSIEDSYVNLALIKEEGQKVKEEKLGNKDQLNSILNTYEDIYADKEPKKLETLFNATTENKEPKKLLIYGRAGIGKTTLVHKIAYEWAQQKLWNDRFDQILWISLRHLTHEWEKLVPDPNGEFDPFTRFIFYCCFSHDKNAMSNRRSIMTNLNSIFQNNPNKILLLLDGYDEIAYLHNPKHSLENQIIERALEHSYYIMTSRPNVVESGLRAKFDLVLENIGLQDEEIDEYVRNFFKESHVNEANSLLDFLQKNREVRGLSHIPINLFLLCMTWDDLKEKLKDQATITLTYLYNETTKWLMKRYLQKFQDENLDFVGNDAIEDREEYQMLENIAFEGMSTRQIIIDSKKLQNLGVKPKMLENVSLKTGLLKAIGDGKKILEKDHYFVHLTFQEYFAARCLVRKLNSAKKEEVKEAARFIEEYKYSRMYERVIWFVAGLVSAEKDNLPLTIFWNLILNGKTDLTIKKQALLIIKCLEESYTHDYELADRLPNESKVIAYVKNVVENSVLDSSMLSMSENELSYLASAPRVMLRIGLEEFLLKEINRENGEKSRAINALKYISKGSEETINALLEIIKTESSDSFEAKRALKEIAKGSEKVIKALLEVIKIESSYIFTIEGPDGFNTEYALKEIAKGSEIAINGLLEIIKTGNKEAKNSAAGVLGYISRNSRAVVKILLEFIKTGDINTKIAAAEALGEMGYNSDEIIITLLELLKTGDKDTKRITSIALEKFGKGSETAVNIWLDIIKTGDIDTKMRAGYAANIAQGSATAVDTLLELIQIGNQYTREAATQALIIIGKGSDKEIRTLLEVIKISDKRSMLRAFTAIGEIGKGSEIAINSMLELVRTGDEETKIQAASVLSDICEDKEIAVNVWKELIKTEDVNIMVLAAHNLEKIGHGLETAINILLELIKTKDEFIRSQVDLSFRTVGKGSEFAIKTILEQVNSGNGKDRRDAIELLAEISDGSEMAIDTLLLLVKDKENNRRVPHAIGKYASNEARCKYVVDAFFAEENNILFDPYYSERIYDIFSHNPLGFIRVIASDSKYYNKAFVEHIIGLVTGNPQWGVTIESGSITIQANVPETIRFTHGDIVARMSFIRSIFDSIRDYVAYSDLSTYFLDKMEHCNKPFPFENMQQMEGIVDTQEKLNQSRHSMLHDQLQVGANHWLASIMIKQKKVTKNENHAFLILEGRNILNEAVFIKMELTQPDPEREPRKSEIKINVEVASLDKREEVLQKNILGNKDYLITKFTENREYFHRYCSINYDTAMNIHSQAEQDKANNSPPYNIRGDRASSVVHAGDNCFTWARKKLRNALGADSLRYHNLSIEGSWTDNILSHPKKYLGNGDSQASCSPLCVVI